MLPRAISLCILVTILSPTCVALDGARPNADSVVSATFEHGERMSKANVTSSALGATIALHALIAIELRAVFSATRVVLHEAGNAVDSVFDDAAFAFRTLRSHRIPSQVASEWSEAVATTEAAGAVASQQSVGMIAYGRARTGDVEANATAASGETGSALLAASEAAAPRARQADAAAQVAARTAVRCASRALAGGCNIPL